MTASNLTKKMLLATAVLAGISAILHPTSPICAQAARSQVSAEYWQQQINYDIEVNLDDEKNELNGFLQFTYINNSPDELGYIHMHLWPNAYKGQVTALAEQLLQNGQTDFYYSKASERGYINMLQFAADGQPLRLATNDETPDLAVLYLNHPLKSGDSVSISTPFHVKLPLPYSRMGHHNHRYQVTQWYPKPAVYDKNGWHPMQYLDDGEFYSEFGNFDVEISLPKDYVVAASGELQTPEELKWLDDKAGLPDSTALGLPNTTPFHTESATAGMKTLRYRAQNVHDFAWFADKTYRVRKGSVALPQSGKTVTTYAMFGKEEGKLWLNAVDYINNTLLYMSEKVGEYPYSTFTAVQGILDAGYGMEYPGATVIGRVGSATALDAVIFHEVAHEWFYGILASNEREHPWIDEGFTSYYENRYVDEAYPGRKAFAIAQRKPRLARFAGMEHYSADWREYWAYLAEARRHTDQAIELSADKYTPDNQYNITYAKSPAAIKYLAESMGTALFDRSMKSLYQRFKFRHLQPEGIREHFEKETGKYLDWFFDELLPTTKQLDYGIATVKRKADQIGKTEYDQITVKNKKGNVRGRFTISAMKGGKPVHTIWYDGFDGYMNVLFPHGDYDTYQIDHARITPDANRANDTYKLHGMFKKVEKLRWQPLGSVENPYRTQLFLSPAVGYNKYNGFMAGLAFYNAIYPSKKFEYALAPMYAFGSKSFAGLGNAAYTQYTKGGFLHHIRYNLAASTFADHRYTVTDTTSTLPKDEKVVSEKGLSYYRIAPEITFSFRKKDPRSFTSTALRLRHINVLKKQPKGPCPEGYNCSKRLLNPESYYVNQLSFLLNFDHPIFPSSLNLSLQQGEGFALATLEARRFFSYNIGKKGFSVRAFAGAFLYNSTRDNLAKARWLTMTDGGLFDYLMDDLYFGRNEIDGISSMQVGQRNGGFKVRTIIGRTDGYLFALNLRGDLPMEAPIPIQLFADFGYSIPKNGIDELAGNREFLFSAGIALTPLPGALEIYLPLLNKKLYKKAIQNNTDKYWERITFYVNLNALNPLKAARRYF